MKNKVLFALLLSLLCIAAIGGVSALAEEQPALSEQYFSGTDYNVGVWLNSKPNGTFRTTFHAAAPFQTITFMGYAGRSENQQHATVHYRLYRWFYNQEATWNQLPAASGSFTADGDGFLTVRFPEQEAGQYIFVLEYPQQQPGPKSYFVVGVSEQPAAGVSLFCDNNITEQGKEWMCGYIGFEPAEDGVYYRTLLTDTAIPADVPVTTKVPFSSEKNMTASKVGWWLELGEKKGVFCIAFHSLYDFTGVEFFSYGGDQNHVVRFALYPWNTDQPAEIGADGTLAVTDSALYTGKETYQGNGLRQISFGKTIDKGQYLFVIQYDPEEQPATSGNHFVVGVAEADPLLPLQIASNGVVDHETYGQSIVNNGFCGNLIVEAPANASTFFAPLQKESEPNTDTGDEGTAAVTLSCFLVILCAAVIGKTGRKKEMQ